MACVFWNIRQTRHQTGLQDSYHHELKEALCVVECVWNEWKAAKIQSVESQFFSPPTVYTRSSLDTGREDPAEGGLQIQKTNRGDCRGRWTSCRIYKSRLSGFATWGYFRSVSSFGPHSEVPAAFALSIRHILLSRLLFGICLPGSGKLRLSPVASVRRVDVSIIPSGSFTNFTLAD